MSKLELNVILNAVDKLTRPFKSAQSTTGKLARSIKESRDALKTLNSQASKIDGFRKTKSELQLVSQQLEKAKTEAKDLARQFKDSSPTASQAEQLRAATKEAAKLSEQFKQLRLSAHNQRTELTKSGIATKNLGNSQRTLKNNIASTTAALQQQQSQLIKTGEQQRRLDVARSKYQNSMQHRAMIAGNGYAALATGRQIARGGIRSLHVGYEFDALMSQTQAVTRVQDKSAPEMQALREQARTLPLSSKFTDSEVAAGQYYLARTGYGAQQVLSAMPAMLNLATAGDLDLGTTADIASNIQTAMGIPAEKMDHVADVLTALFTRNNVDIQMLGESLKYSAGVGREFGQSLETVAASTAMLGSAGIQGSQAGTTMRSILSRIAISPTVKKLGVKTADKDGNMRDLVDILKDIDKKTAKMGNVERGAIYKTIAGQYSVTGFGVLMRAASDGSLEKMRGKDGEYNGEAVRVARTMMDNLKGDMTILHAGLENISVELFEKNNDWLRRTAQQFSHILHNVAEFLKQNPKVSKGIVIAGAALAAITTLVGGLMIGIVGILAPLTLAKLSFTILGIKGFGATSLLAKGFGLIGSVLAVVGRVLLAHPIISFITIVAGAAYYIWKNWDWLKASFFALWEKLKQASSIAWEYIKIQAVNAGKALVDYFNNWALIDTLKSKWQDIVNSMAHLKDNFLDAGRQLIDWIMDGINERWQALKTRMQAIADILPDSIKSMMGIEIKSDIPQNTEQTNGIPNNSILSAGMGGYVVTPYLTAYQPLKQQKPANTFIDNSKNEITITGMQQDGHLLAAIKKVLSDAEKEKVSRQRGLLADIH